MYVNESSETSEAEDIDLDEYYDELASEEKKYLDEREEELSGSFPSTEPGQPRAATDR